MLCLSLYLCQRLLTVTVSSEQILAVPILILPLSVNIDVGTGTNLCDKHLRIFMSHELACKPITLL